MTSDRAGDRHADAFDAAAAIAAVETEIARYLDGAPEGGSLVGMMRYHLGWATADFTPERAKTGKRLRPLVCLLCCAAAGGAAERALPAAAAVELLHNFTLVHDDIQDNSAFRHNRRTVWSIWGMAQGINVGDGMHAIAQRALFGLRERGLPAPLVLDLAVGLDETVLRICAGQVRDIDFERRWDIGGADYREMIAGKTAAIFAYAARAGALIAGLPLERADAFDAFGAALGLGFQVRDDLLGIWGATDVTGKQQGDDIRRRKKSLPIIMLHERANEADRAYLEGLYATDEVAPGEIATVVQMLDRAGVRDDCQEIVERYHIEAAAHLNASGATGPAAAALAGLIETMAGREA